MSSRSLSLLLYNALLPLGLLFMAPAALIKMRRRGGRWQDFAQRLGFIGERKMEGLRENSRIPEFPKSEFPKSEFPNSLNPNSRIVGEEEPMQPMPSESGNPGIREFGIREFGNCIWMHAVSVGEVGVARRLITAMLKAEASCHIVLTTTTPTGYALASEMEQAFAGRVLVLYSPLDLPFIARRMLRLLQPRQLVLIEAEVWPNIVATAKDMGIPVVLVNARLSPRSEARYRQFLPLVQPIFAMLDEVLVQEPGDVERWAGIGAAREHIQCIGSLKYDPQGADADPAQVAALREILTSAGIDPARPILLAASTHAGEESEIGKVFVALRAELPGLALLVVPRHFERAAEVLMELRQLGLAPVLRSGISPDHHPSTINQLPTEVLIIDSTGELCAWQSLATVVVIGKSFLAEGGQNPAEAVMAGKPVVFGPHMENFAPLVALLLSCGGAVQVSGLGKLADALRLLFSDAGLRTRTAEAGRAALSRHQGAIQRAVEILCRNK